MDIKKWFEDYICEIICEVENHYNDASDNKDLEYVKSEIEFIKNRYPEAAKKAKELEE